VQILRNIEAALAKAGAGLKDVVRTRIYVTDIGYFDEVAKAHNETFAQILPTATLVEVSRLIDSAMLVEIEVDAVISPRAGFSLSG